MDRFKEINDALGHDAGDFLLKTVASILTEITGPDARCFRIGGDKFLIAFEGGQLNQDIRHVAERIIAAVERPLDYRGHVCRAGASLGIAFGRDAAFDAAATLINADLALYEAKRDGRRSCRFYASELQSLSRHRKEISDLVLEAIETEAFIPFYQPQFFADGLRLRGVETLCRWHHDERGWILPADFLPIAEELKVVGHIDQILFRKVARDVGRLHDLGFVLPKVSFNLTADRLLLSDLADELANTFRNDTRVAVELLESMSLDSLSDSVSWAIETLKDRGVEIEIDDFGSCRASVAGLIAVGPDAMKIDRAIISPITESPKHLQLVRAIIEIGRALNIEVVAEGVETEAHIDILRGLGCDVLQGYALARPMPFAELVDLVRQGKRTDVKDRAATLHLPKSGTG